MPSDVKTKAISLLKAAILGIKAEKRYMCHGNGETGIYPKDMGISHDLTIQDGDFSAISLGLSRYSN